jgi:two-component system, chemotaxis family, sensor kinase CheA
MDVQRYLDLFVAETEEHLRLLHRSLLAMEAQPDGAALNEAFRAAHTLKSLSSAMGYTAVAGIAHELEDALAEVRAGGLLVQAPLVDRMLAQADALETGIAAAVAPAPAPVPAMGATPAVSHDHAGAAAGDPAPAAAQTSTMTTPAAARVVHVRLRPDAPLKPVRAMLVMRALEGRPGVIGTDPDEFGEGFAGEFRIFFANDADVESARAAILAAGEIETVELVDAHAQPGELDRSAGGRAGSGAASTTNTTTAATGATGAPAASTASAAPVARQLRVDAARVDSLAEGIGELSVLFSRLDPDQVRLAGLDDLVDRMAVVLGDVQHDVMKLRMVPVRVAFERLPRVVRDAARVAAREVELIVAGDDVELDRAILDEITEPLVHLLRNAVDHGIEPPAERAAAGKSEQGRIELRAERERSSVRISVTDDGRGIDAARVVERARLAGLMTAEASGDIDGEELLRLLGHPGFSTASQVSAVSGRGVGMDVVVSRVRALGGAIELETLAGAGTTFSLRLPISLAQTQALRVRVGGEDYAIPLTHISEAVELDGIDGPVVEVRGTMLPVIRLRSLLRPDAAGAAAFDGSGEGEGSRGGEQTAVVAGTAARRAALAVDELVGREQILVRSFDAAAGLLPFFSGATLLADGRPALVIDPLSVL